MLSACGNKGGNGAFSDDLLADEELSMAAWPIDEDSFILERVAGLRLGCLPDLGAVDKAGFAADFAGAGAPKVEDFCAAELLATSTGFAT
jgi:hypothetical protein